MKKILFIATLFTSLNAFAYLDPGTGSIIIQGLIAGVAAVIVFVKNFWVNIKSFFTKKKKSK